jgi:5'-AMP-activated protein kinase catalytic alpha subunit
LLILFIYSKVAIKILEKVKIKDLNDKRRVEKEINILKKLKHPNIISLLSVVESENKIYIITEHCSGGELFEYIVSKIKLIENEASRIFSQLISGVDYLHRMSIVHRDLKPENLLFGSNKELKIADFGLSSVYTRGGTLSTACGSPCYAAPEMVRGLKYEASPVDIWSCGIVLFTMVCGFLPFEDDNQDKLFNKIIKGQFQIPSHLSPMCKDLLKRILNVNPNTRVTFEQIKEHPWLKLNYNYGSSFSTIFSGLDISQKIIPVNIFNLDRR